MATKIETLKKPNGDQVLPRTRAKAVSMENGTTVEAAINDISSLVGSEPVSEQIEEAVAQKAQVQIITWEEND